MNTKDLPVYQHRQDILKALEQHQVIIVESPTGSGKTTQIPVILHEAGYTKMGVIGITQPRRIATLSVSEFITKQIDATIGDVVGYKMRFEDVTSPKTVIKILTDGTLLQELKTDPLLSAYQIIMIDEAHERSLNIDFTLGLLKTVLKKRSDLKVIISSATLNSQVFSSYFNQAPLVSIATQNYPVSVIYSPVANETDEALVDKIVEICDRIIIEDHRSGDILIFLPGEKLIRKTIAALALAKARKKTWLLPLYGMLGKEEQERVFLKPPSGKVKIVVSTNMAETSLTIEGITTVIDSGRCKENRYNAKTYTSSLVDSTISQASANQRKGRAGRTQPGSCYRLYSKANFDERPSFSVEEIYRTDLSEVVLRMAGLGITDFMSFDFISKPNASGIKSSIETLKLLDALNDEEKLTKTGELMLLFPLLPRHARIMVESILHYPDAITACSIITAFLSTNNPYLFPQDEELDARKRQHHFRDERGDFFSYLKLYDEYAHQQNEEEQTAFCTYYYLDQRIMNEIVKVKEQLESVASDLGLTIDTHSRNVEEVLICCGYGLKQFICILTGREHYRSLTAEHIFIHPSSAVFKETPKYIIAGEIMKTTRTYARSVSPVSLEIIEKISTALVGQLTKAKASKAILLGKEAPKKIVVAKSIKNDCIILAGYNFPIVRQVAKNKKRKKTRVVFEWHLLDRALKATNKLELESWQQSELKGTVVLEGIEILKDTLLPEIFEIVQFLQQKSNVFVDRFASKHKDFLTTAADFAQFVQKSSTIGSLFLKNQKGNKKTFAGFICLKTNHNGLFWFAPALKYPTFLQETLLSLEELADYIPQDANHEDILIINQVYRKLENLSQGS